MKRSAGVSPSPPSATLGESMDSVGGSSSSVISMLAPVTAMLPEAPVTLMVSASSSRLSSTGSRLKVFRAPVSMAGMVMSKPATAA